MVSFLWVVKNYSFLFTKNSIVRCIMVIAYYRCFHVIIRSLSTFCNPFWLINIEGCIGKVIFDRASYKLLQSNHWSIIALFLYMMLLINWIFIFWILFYHNLLELFVNVVKWDRIICHIKLCHLTELVVNILNQ